MTRSPTRRGQSRGASRTAQPGTPAVAAFKTRAQAAGRGNILSYRDIDRTLRVVDTVAILGRQQAQGADIRKIGVMPDDPADLLRLLEAT